MRRSLHGLRARGRSLVLGTGLCILSAAGCGQRPSDPYAVSRATYEDNRAAHAAYVRGDWEEAEELFVRMLERYSTTYDAQVLTPAAEETWLRGYHDLGCVRLAQGEYGKAVGNFTSAMEYVSFQTVFMLQTLGFACRLAGQDEEAERWFRKSLAEPTTQDNRIARLSLALLYCESGRAEDLRAEQKRLDELEDDPAGAAKDLYPPGDASYWNYDQVRQEAFYRERLASALARGERECLEPLYRLVLALEGASYGLQTSDRCEERLRVMAETVELGRSSFGSDHVLVAQALEQLARAEWKSARRFAGSQRSLVHRIGARDAAIVAEQEAALGQLDPDGEIARGMESVEARRRSARERASQLYEQARGILQASAEPAVGLRRRVEKGLESVRGSRDPSQ